jgi:glutathione peroxidase
MLNDTLDPTDWKILGRDGTLAGAFGSPVEPTDTRIILAIEKQLPAA